MRQGIRDSFRAVRPILSESLKNMPSAQLAGFLSPEASEDFGRFLRGIQSVGRAAAPVLQRALPGLVQGATTGAMMGGPVGAILGAVGGGALSALQPGSPPPALTSGGAGAPQSPPLPPQLPAGGGVGGVPGGSAASSGSPAAGALLSLLADPRVIQAIAAMTLGQRGASAVPVGNTAVPVGAVANLIGQLAQQALSEHHQVARFESEVPSYLVDRRGRLRCDPMVPRERAEVLLELLQDSMVETQEAERHTAHRAHQAPNAWDESDLPEASEAVFADADEALESAFLEGLDQGWRGRS